MINLNPDATSVISKLYPNGIELPKPGDAESQKSGFADTIESVEKYLHKVDELQQTSDESIKDLLAGKNEDINSVVAAVAEADVSFKLLLGIRNKLIEAYKQTMNMPI